ncbi:hypothetical protein [Kribbella flavida]|nr:hypothetical protein [Kribbella flavida]
MAGPTTDARIYLLAAGERQVAPGGPAVVGPDGVREEIPVAVFEAVRQVVEVLRAGMAVKVSPLRPELPIDEAADAIGMAPDDLRAYAAEGAIPFRSSESVHWVRLAELVAWDNDRRARRAEGIQAMLDEDPWDAPDEDRPRP